MPMQGEAIEFDEHARTQEIHMISSHTNRQNICKNSESGIFRPTFHIFRTNDLLQYAVSRPETRVVCGVGGHATRIGAHDGDMLS